MPQYGTKPTSTWQPGETVQDPHRLAIPKDAPHPDAARLFLDYLLSQRGQEVGPNVLGANLVQAARLGTAEAASLYFCSSLSSGFSSAIG